MAAYDGHSIGAYQMVMVNAESEEDALERASCALEARAGFVPVSAHTAAELHELAEALSTRELELGQAYNLTMGMTDEEVAEWDGSAGDEESPSAGPVSAPHVGRTDPSPQEPAPF